MKLFNFQYSLKTNVIAGAVFLLVFIVFFWLQPSIKDINCNHFKSLRNVTYNGVVINKFIDSTQHNYPTVVIRQIDNSIYKFDLTHDKSGLYGFLLIGDTLVKRKGSYNINVSRYEMEKTFELDYGCED